MAERHSTDHGSHRSSGDVFTLKTAEHVLQRWIALLKQFVEIDVCFEGDREEWLELIADMAETNDAEDWLKKSKPWLQAIADHAIEMRSRLTPFVIWLGEKPRTANDVDRRHRLNRVISEMEMLSLGPTAWKFSKNTDV